MKIKVTADSTCDLSQELIEKYNITIIPLSIVKDGKTLGAIGVLGPRRMDYAKVLATLEGLSGNIANMIQGNNQLNGGNPDGGNENNYEENH